MSNNTIEVQFPTSEERQVPITNPRERIMYRSDFHTVRRSVNKASKVYVRVLTKTPVQPFDAEVMCLELTGMTPKAYQNKFKRAWNE